MCQTTKNLLQSSVDRMLKRGNASMMVGASSWKDQFVDAFTVQAGNKIHLPTYDKVPNYCPSFVFFIQSKFCVL